ncbi:hypothetical protein NFI96_033821 [Prochilodus magdalenae]|nr:hypothetical protein NFI96_033821 [Prochilodus magdalenae]
MALSRAVIMMCFLAMLPVGNTTEISETTALVGQNVSLPCPCSEKVEKVVWQIKKGKDHYLIVNHYNANKQDITPPHDSFKDRSHVSPKNGQCSLLLYNVSPQDQEIFTCYTFTTGEMPDTHSVNLTIIESPKPQVNPSMKPSPSRAESAHGLIAGIFSSVALLVGVVIIGVILFIKYRQRRPKTEAFMDPQAGLSMMSHSPV